MANKTKQNSLQNGAQKHLTMLSCGQPTTRNHCPCSYITASLEKKRMEVLSSCFPHCTALRTSSCFPHCISSCQATRMHATAASHAGNCAASVAHASALACTSPACVLTNCPSMRLKSSSRCRLSRDSSACRARGRGRSCSCGCVLEAAMRSRNQGPLDTAHACQLHA